MHVTQGDMRMVSHPEFLLKMWSQKAAKSESQHLVTSKTSWKKRTLWGTLGWIPKEHSQWFSTIIASLYTVYRLKATWQMTKWHQSKIKSYKYIYIYRLSLFTFWHHPWQENLPLPCYFLPATSPWRVFFDENNAPFSTGPWTPDSHGCNSYIEICPWKLISLGAAVRKMAPSETTNFVAPTFDGPCILLKDTQWLLKDP